MGRDDRAIRVHRPVRSVKEASGLFMLEPHGIDRGCQKLEVGAAPVRASRVRSKDKVNCKKANNSMSKCKVFRKAVFI